MMALRIARLIQRYGIDADRRRAGRLCLGLQP